MIGWVEAREPIASWVSVHAKSLPDTGVLNPYPGLSWVPVDATREALINGATGGWVVAERADRSTIEGMWNTTVTPAENPIAAALWRRGLAHVGGHGAFDGIDVAAAIEQTRQRYTLVMLLSTGCNLACNYCYLGHQLPTRDVSMPSDIATAAIDAALEKDWDEVMFDFGEIAVSWSSFDALATEAVTRTRSRGKRPRIAIQTNGTAIDPRSADRLAELDAVVGISLDGPRAVHDAARTFRSGAGSYGRAVNAIRLLRERSVAVHLIATIGRHNVDQPISVVEELLTHDPTSFLLKPVLAEGEAGAAWDDEGISPRQFGEFTRTVIQHAAHMGPDRLDQSATKFLNRLLGDRNGWRDSCTSRYCGSGRTLHVVDPKGGTHSCPRFVADAPSKSPGPIPITLTSRARVVPNLGNLLEDTLRQAPSDCSGCAWLSSCGGGCTLISHDDDQPGMPQPDPHCDAYDISHHELFTTMIPAYMDGQHRGAYAFNGAQVVTVGN